MVRDALDGLGMSPLVKTSGASGIHLYVPIVRGPTQKAVWTFAKALAKELEKLRPKLITAEYRIAKRPRGRVLVDYNQNAWGRTLASVYSVRPTPRPRVDSRHLEGSGKGVRDRRFPHRQRAEAGGDAWATSGNRCSPRAAGSGWRRCCDSPAPLPVRADGGHLAR